MFKKLARHILKDELSKKDDKIVRLTLESERLSKIINTWEHEDSVAREYTFAPKGLDQEEMEIVGRYIDTPIIGLMSKWFKTRADQNNDMLVHNIDASEEKKALYRIAVLAFDDWHMFTEKCGQLYNKAQKEEAKKKGK